MELHGILWSSVEFGGHSMEVSRFQVKFDLGSPISSENPPGIIKAGVAIRDDIKKLRDIEEEQELECEGAEGRPLVALATVIAARTVNLHHLPLCLSLICHQQTCLPTVMCPR